MSAAHRLVAVEPDDQRIALRARPRQIRDVAGVQQIEDAVGEDDAAARARAAASRHATARVEVEDAAPAKRSASPASLHSATISSRRRGRRAELLDHRAGGEVRELHRGLDRRSRAASASVKHRDHRIAGAADVEHRARDRRDVEALAVRDRRATCRARRA